MVVVSVVVVVGGGGMGGGWEGRGLRGPKPLFQERLRTEENLGKNFIRWHTQQHMTNAMYMGRNYFWKKMKSKSKGGSFLFQNIWVALCLPGEILTTHKT